MASERMFGRADGKGDYWLPTVAYGAFRSGTGFFQALLKEGLDFGVFVVKIDIRQALFGFQPRCLVYFIFLLEVFILSSQYRRFKFKSYWLFFCYYSTYLQAGCGMRNYWSFWRFNSPGYRTRQAAL